MNRKVALDTIRAEYATHGDATTAAMRAYVESRVSYAAYTRAMKAGMMIYNKED